MTEVGDGLGLVKTIKCQILASIIVLEEFGHGLPLEERKSTFKTVESMMARLHSLMMPDPELDDLADMVVMINRLGALHESIYGPTK